MLPPCRAVTLPCGASVPAAERVWDGVQEELTSEVKDTCEEGEGRSMSSSQEERHMLPETSVKSRRCEKASLPESNIKRENSIYYFNELIIPKIKVIERITVLRLRLKRSLMTHLTENNRSITLKPSEQFHGIRQ